ncbi:YwqJ-related putative deaminase [Photorhabdus heterorhabditis]|uniref:YwqJ-related putative deaminase n=1 Tax=Photorhabdus heterorhabditis TaxID=880156 RepID=UPI001BD37011|nr:YwqJ-related putative deaminase [Photorhabdus heterorhabditis]MBS9442584.1 hypothetical protein [Photorhabdus heterorhabditis]
MFQNRIRNEKTTQSDKGKTLDRMTDSLCLEIPNVEAVMLAYRKLTGKYKAFSDKTKLILDSSEKFGKLKYAKQCKFIMPGLNENGVYNGSFIYSKKSLQDFSAHAGYEHNGHYKDEFVNFKDNKGNLAKGKLFPGISLIERRKLSIVKNKEGKWEYKEIDEAEVYEVTDIEKFISGVRGMYRQGNTFLHAETEVLIRKHIINNENILPTMAGIAGLHAEVQALNNLFILGDKGTEKREKWKYIRDMLESSIFTQRLTTVNAGKDFAACHNCSGILSSPVNVITGKVESAGGDFSSTLSRYNMLQESPI